MRTIMVICGLVLVAGAISRPAAAPPSVAIHPDGPNRSRRVEGRAWFENVASELGIDFRHQSGHDKEFYLPESMSGGVGLLDYDRDGYLDVYFVQGGSLTGQRRSQYANVLYRNLGNGRFVDVTASAGVGDLGYGMGCACGDFDGDGWTDIYVTNVGSNVLFHNNKDGSFSDATADAGVGDKSFGASAVFVDYDRDGDLDLFVANYVDWAPDREVACPGPSGSPDYCSPLVYKAPARDTLYRNNGGGVFSDVTESSGVAETYGNGLGVACGDFNRDGLVDIAVANDLMANQLWINLGHGKFRDEAVERGVAYSGTGVAESGMGVDARDADQDGDLDLFMTHFKDQTNTFYENRNGFFTDRTDEVGLRPSLPFVGFGTAMVDLNNDGLIDMFVANGRVLTGPRYGKDGGPYALPNQLFLGTGKGKYREYMPRGGTVEPVIHASRGAAFGDFDNDGGIDIFIVNRDGPAYLLRNRIGSANHWITFRVTNRRGGCAIGARVEIDAGGRQWIRYVRPGYSYCSSNDPRVHFGLGNISRVDKVVVTWVDGSTTRFGPFAADQIIHLTPP